MLCAGLYEVCVCVYVRVRVCVCVYCVLYTVKLLLNGKPNKGHNLLYKGGSYSTMAIKFYIPLTEQTSI